MEVVSLTVTSRTAELGVGGGMPLMLLWAECERAEMTRGEDRGGQYTKLAICHLYKE
jgi:hypothetical protein